MQRTFVETKDVVYVHGTSQSKSCITTTEIRRYKEQPNKWKEEKKSFQLRHQNALLCAHLQESNKRTRHVIRIREKSVVG